MADYASDAPLLPLEAALSPSPGGTASSKSVWIHDDPRGMGVAIESAMKRAAIDAIGAPLSQGWIDRGGGWDRNVAAADFRALLVASLYAVDDAASSDKRPAVLTPAQVAKYVPPGLAPGGAIVVGPRVADDYAGASIWGGLARRDACMQIQLGWIAMMERFLLGLSEADVGAWPIRAYTAGGSPPIPIPAVPSAEGWPLVAVFAIGAASIAWLGTHAMDVNAAKHLADEDTRRLTNTIAAAVDVVQRHTDSDRAAGTSTPYSEGEKTLLETLGVTVKDFGEATKIRAAKGGDAAAAAAGAVGSLVTLVGLAIVGYLVLKGTSK